MKHRITESQLRNIIQESLKTAMNEGAGAGYSVELKGLKADNLKLLSGRRDEYGMTIRFKADIMPGTVEWAAQDYYNGVTSDGIEWDGTIMQEYTDEDKQVNGGTIEGHVYAGEFQEGSTADDVRAEIQYYLNDFDIKGDFGGGWSHVNLDNQIVFTDQEIGGEGYVTLYVDKLTVNAPQIAENINWFFENNYKFDEIFGEGGEDELNEGIGNRLKTLAAAGLIGLGAASCDKNYNEPVGPDQSSQTDKTGEDEDDDKGKDDDNTYDTRLYKDGKAYFPAEIESGYLDDKLQESGSTDNGEYVKFDLAIPVTYDNKNYDVVAKYYQDYNDNNKFKRYYGGGVDIFEGKYTQGNEQNKVTDTKSIKEIKKNYCIFE